MKPRISVPIFCVLLIYITFFELDIIPNAIYQLLKIFVVVTAGAFLLCHFNIRDALHYKSLILVYVISIILSSIVNNGIQFLTLAGLIYAVELFELSALIIYIYRNGFGSANENVLICILMIYLLVNDVFVIRGITDIFSEKYLIGNKYNVGYMHFFLAGLLWKKYDIIDNKKHLFKVKLTIYTLRKCSIYGFILYTILICMLVDCQSAVVGAILLAILMFLPRKAKDFLENGKIMIGLAVIYNVCFFAYQSLILENDYINYLITKILHHDIELNGRIAIYRILSEVIKSKLYLGYGYSNAALIDYIGFGNAQNGFLGVAVDYGVLGIIAFLSIWYASMKKKFMPNWPLIAVLYVFVALSSVEITFGKYFVVLLILIYANGRYEKVHQNHVFCSDKNI